MGLYNYNIPHEHNHYLTIYICNGKYLHTYSRIVIIVIPPYPHDIPGALRRELTTVPPLAEEADLT